MAGEDSVDGRVHNSTVASIVLALLSLAASTHAQTTVVATSRVQHATPAKSDVSGAKIEVRRASGYLFVRPRVNGRQSGWFFFDTGAYIMCVDSGVVARVGAKRLGSASATGMTASFKTQLYRIRDFQLGPVKLKNETFMAVDLASYSKELGLPIAGICGYQFISRSVIDIDPSLSFLSIHPAGFRLEPTNIQWNTVRFDGKTPMIQCSFEGNNRGLFRIDTGSNSTVDFFTSAVKRFSLLTQRATTDSQFGGAGGFAKSKKGQVLYFEFGGYRFEKPTVGFQLGEAGVISNSIVDGNIGMGFLSQFRIVLDYPRGRIGFIPVGGENPSRIL